MLPDVSYLIFYGINPKNFRRYQLVSFSTWARIDCSCSIESRNRRVSQLTHYNQRGGEEERDGEEKGEGREGKGKGREGKGRKKTKSLPLDNGLSHNDPKFVTVLSGA
jgi:hypothetical protein